MVLKRTSIKEQLHGLIRKKILNQEYQLGEKINMLSLQQEFGVSNTPLREAITMLERDGLVELRQNVGPHVVSFTAESFQEISDTSALLLLGSYDLCLSEARIDHLTGLLEKHYQIQESLVETGSDVDFATAALQFDESFLLACENKKLQSIYHNLFDLFYLAILLEHQKLSPDRRINLAEHKQILNAVKNGNQDEVRQLIYAHFNRKREWEEQHDL